jgi:glutamate-ammonia-ligase adenylyltransferase
MNLSNILSTIPPLLQSEFNRLWQDYQSNNNNPIFIDSLPKVWTCSKFVAQNCLQSPELLKNLIDSGDLFNAPNSNSYQNSLNQQLIAVKDETTLMQVLRLFRRREMLRIAWRDLAGWASLEESLKSLSDLADTIIDITLSWLHKSLVIQFGTPCYPDGSPQSLVVLALGKLGGQELNFSSDIDLIFAYPSEGETKGVKRCRSYQEFFLRLGQQLIQVLTQITPEGFVYRVDMRLRPFGDGAPLVMSFAGMEDYYQAHARDWERYALVKARVVAGVAGKSLLKNLRPFVYRRYLDFNAFEALRKMKAMIDNETSRKGLNNNIKLGKGGIREIEFTCQVFQLIRGGQQPALQQRHLLTTLVQLEKYKILSREAINCLREAYQFLRLTENHLQAIDDKQTQNLPDNALNQARLAYSMGFSDWNHFLAKLLQHQQAVHIEYEQVIAPEPAAYSSPQSSRWQTLWMDGLQDAENLLKVDFKDSSEIARNLRQLLTSRTIQKLSQSGREKLDNLIPLAISIAIKQRFPDDALLRTLKLIESIARRSVYLSLLVERPEVLKQWIYLCGESAWVAEQITRYPLLLDELLDPRSLYDPLKSDELENALQAQLAHLPSDDLDVQMNSLRQFKCANVLHIAAAELSGKLITTLASDYLTSLADSLMRRALSIALDYLVQKHGQPRYLVNGELHTAELCIVAYGKAGGMELSYGSDLDIVFLYDGSGSNTYTDGNKSLDNHVFFMRLAQRIIHILTINTPAGILYEVDSRLRPGGESGQLVSSFDAFKAYQEQNAWTWEHQALVRARAVAGTQNTTARFENIRREVLSSSRNINQLKQDVCDMRIKMRENLDKTKGGIFDLKQGYGGIADIEFIIQYGVLRWAADYPQLLETTGMLPLLRLFAKEKLLDELACIQLGEAFKTYRAETHRLALQNQRALVDKKLFIEQQQQVKEWWEKFLVN